MSIYFCTKGTVESVGLIYVIILFTHSLDAWSQLRRVVCYEFVDLLPGAPDDGETLGEGPLERHRATHGLARPKTRRRHEDGLYVGGDKRRQGY